MLTKLLLPLLLAASLNSVAQNPNAIAVGAEIPIAQVSVHDPVMIKASGRFYLFCTGNGISMWSSSDLKTWKKEAPVFSTAPQWAKDTIPNFRGHIWAPDISFYNDQYYLFYSVSAFGKNTSAIGLATNKTLDPSSPDFKWEDHGRVIQSYPGKTNWNAIDPNLIADKKQAYLAFGSFWSGLQLIKLSSDRQHTEGTTSIIASRMNIDTISNNAGPNAIEAPFIYQKGKYYYLLASIDYCCKAEKSTYKVIVGRSQNVAGPYLDKEGKDLAKGGGTILIAGDNNWFGVGHNGVCSADGKEYFVYHGYDAADKGRSKLLIKTITWDKAQWPVLK